MASSGALLAHHPNNSYLLDMGGADFPTLASVHDLRARMAALRRIALKTADVDFLKDRLALLFAGYGLSTPVLTVGQKLFRGIFWPSLPKHIAQLTYPPANAVKNFGRLNRPNQSIFYSSAARAAVFFELGVKPGDHVAVSQWRSTDKLWMNNVGFAPGVFRKFKSTRQEPASWQTSNTHPLIESKANKLVHHFLADEFSKVVSPDTPYDYKLSVAIAEKLLFGNLEANIVDGPKDTRFAGLVYPTMAMRANSDNIALLPEFVDRYLTLHEVEYIRIDAADPESLKYEITVVDFANTFAGELIEWKGRHRQWTLPPQTQIKMVVDEQGQWVAYDTEGREVPAS